MTVPRVLLSRGAADHLIDEGASLLRICLGIAVDALLLLTFAQDPWGGWLWPTYLLLSLGFYTYVGVTAYRGAARARNVGLVFAVAFVTAFAAMIGGLVFFSGALLALFGAWMLALRQGRTRLQSTT